MDTQDPPTDPAISLLGDLIGLDNKKDAMMSRCLDRKEVRCAIWQVHSTGSSRPVETQHVFF